MVIKAKKDDLRPEPRTTRDWHVYHVYNDPEFKEALSSLALLEEHDGDAQKISELTAGIVQYFGLTVGEFRTLQLGELLYLDPNEKTANLSMDPKSKTGTITFDLLATTQKEIEELFATVLSIRERNWKVKPVPRRSVGEPNLVYAVFKAKKSGMTFRAISELYVAGKLPGYKGSTTQYADPKLLYRFYSRHKP